MSLGVRLKSAGEGSVGTGVSVEVGRGVAVGGGESVGVGVTSCPRPVPAGAATRMKPRMTRNGPGNRLRTKRFVYAMLSTLDDPAIILISVTKLCIYSLSITQ